MDELQILLQAVLDEIKSLQNIEKSLEKIRNQVTLPVSAELDIPNSLQKIRKNIESLEKLHIDLTGRLDRTETRKALKKDLKALSNEEVTVRAKIDKAALRKSIKEAGGKAATIDIDTNIEGAGNLEKISDGLDGINKKSAATVASVTLLNQALIELEQAAARMIQTSAAIDEQLTNIRMVTGDSYTDVIQLAQAYNALAKEIKATTSQVLEGSTEWLRQGMTESETTALIKQSMILSKVGIMDSASATTNLTSAMKGYGLAVEDVSSVVDKLTAIDMEAAVSASDLAVAMSRTATGANIAGVSMDRLLGYLATVQEVTQKSAETVGESLKTMFARMNNIKLGVFVDDDGESLNDTEKILKEFGIALRDTNDEFKSSADILDELHAKWDSFTTLEKSAVSTAAAGTRQRENFLVLMEHYGEALKYAEVAANSAGTAIKKFEAYQDSLGAKLNNFIAAFESLSLNTFDPQFLGVLVDAGASILSFIDSIHLLQSALIGLSTAGILKGFTMIAGSVKNAYNDVLKLSTAFDIMGKAKGVGVAADQMQALLAVTKGLSESQLRLIVSNGALTNAQRMAILTASGLTKEQAAQILSTMGLATAETTATAATFSLSGAMKALGAAIKANPIGFLATAVSAAVSIIHIATGAIEDAKAATAELRQETIAESEALSETVSLFKEAYLTAAQYRNQQKLTSAEERDFQSAVESATEALGGKKLAIDDATASTEDYIEALQEASKQELKNAALKANDAADAARETLQETVYDFWSIDSEKVGFEIVGSNIDKQSEEYKKAWKIVLSDLAQYAKEVGKTAEKQTIFGTIEAVTEWHIEPNDFQDVGSVVSYYYDLLEVKDKLNEAGLRETAIYKAINGDVGRLGDVVDKYVKTEYDRLSLNYMYQNSIPDSMDSFFAYREYMQKNMGELFAIDDLPSIVDTYLSGETNQYAQYIGELNNLTTKRQMILDKVTSSDIWQAHNAGYSENYHKNNLLKHLETLSDSELDIVYGAVLNSGITTWNEMTAAIAAYNAEQTKVQSGASILQASLSDLWNSDDFADTRKELESMAKTVSGITSENIKELVAESEDLASVLESDGMNAQFLANVLQTTALGGDGFALITEDAIALNKVLDGIVGSFENVTAAKAHYDAALSVKEKDVDFKSYAEAFAELNAQFEAGTTNSNAFWAAAEFLFGREQLAVWGWRDGLEEIRQAMESNKTVFEDADSAGAGFIDRLYKMAEAGELVNENGEKLIEIFKAADGGYKFDVEPENIADIADAMHLTEEAVLACFQALSMWGNVNFYDIMDVVGQLKQMKLIADTADGQAVNFSRLTEQLLTLGKTDLEITDLTSALQNQGVTLLSVTDNVGTLTSNLQELGIAASDGVTIAVDYEGLANLMSQIGFTKEEAQNLITTLSGANDVSLTNASGEVQGISDALAYIDTLTFDTVTTNIGDISSAIGDLNKSSTDDAVSEIDAVGSAAETAATKVYSIGDAIDSIDGKSCTVTYNVQRKDNTLSMFGFANGTKHAPAGKALVGEDGAELWQSEDKARLVGVDGPEIVDLNEGDRIYTNEQTRKIFGSSGKRMTGTIPAYRNGLRNDFEKVNWALIGDDGDVVEVPAGGISGEVTIKPKPDESNTGDGGNSNRVSNEFENLYKKHQHLLAMDQESQEEYLAWLRDAYQKAYKDGEIELDDYYQYQEEVYHGLQDLFRDYIGDNEHLIDMLSHYDHTDGQIISIYQSMMAEIQKEISAARASGMDDSDEYIQELQKKWMDYFDSVDEIYDKTTDSAKEAVDELVDYRIDMIKQELGSERDALDAKLDYLRDFYDKQKELLQDQSDNDRYLRDQQEKRRAVSDIQEDLDRIRFDDSAWAQRRKLELQEELAEAQRELKDFEDDHALDLALKALDDAYGSQEKNMQAEMDALEEKLNDPNALYNRALEEIKNTSKDQLYYQMLMYNRQYGDGKDETVIELWESAFGALDDYSRLFGELYKGIELSNETGITENGNSWDTSPISGTNPENQKSDASSAEVKPVLEEGVQITVKHSATHFGSNSANKRIDGAVPGGEYTVYQIDDDEVLIGRDGVYAGWIKKSDIVGYAKGTKYASAGLHRFNEKGSEYIFADQGGGKYRMFSEGEKVLDAESSSWLHGFATSRGKSVVDKILASFHNADDEIVNRIVGSSYRVGDNIERLARSISNNQVINNNIDAGDINIQGSATEKTVSQIRREKRERIDDMLSAFNRLRKQW